MCTTKERGVKYCSIVGAHLLMAPLSFLWIFGNFSAYMDSYFRFSCYPKCADCNTQWLLSLYIGGGCPGALLTKILVTKLGLKRTGIFAMFMYSLTLLGSAWVLQHSVAGTAVLYLFLGQAVAISYSVSYQLVNGWAPDNFAFFTATVTGFPTTLSVIQNQLVTAYVNPHNLKTDAYVSHRTYFSQLEILNRVPKTVMLFGAMTFGLQLMGCILITNPPRLSSKEPFTCEPGRSKSNILENTKSASDTPPSSVSLNEDENRYKLKTYGSNNDHNETIKVYQSYQSVPSTTKLNRSTGNFAERGLNATTPTEGIPKSWKPSETIKTPVFYAVWLFGASLLYGLILKSNYYKQFALLYINDDKFLTLVGTLIPIVSTVSRIIFGACLDKGLLSIKDTVVLSLSLQVILCAFWFFAPQVNAVLYLILILCLALTQCTIFLIIPIAALRIFGPEHFSTNYGLLLSKNLFAGFLTPLVISPLLDILGWFWLFTSVSIVSLLALVCVILTNFNIN